VSLDDPTHDELPACDEEAIFERLSDMLAGFMRTQALSVAVSLGVPEAVSQVPVDVGEIALRVGADEQSVYRLMRFLASEGVFAEVEPRRFTATRLSNGLRADPPLSARSLAIVRGSEFYRCWSEALHSIVTGEPAFGRVYGGRFFDYLAQHPDRSTVFNRAMAEKTSRQVAALEGYDWADMRRVVDLGGGNGTALAAVLGAHPHLDGVLFDLPTVVGGAGEVLRAAGVSDRCEILGGDFFSDSLPCADAYILSQILHDWDDDHACAILTNCRRGVDDGGRLVLVEGVVPDGPQPSFLKLLDLHMLILLGGKERTENEWSDLLRKAGFQLHQVMPNGLIDARAS